MHSEETKEKIRLGVKRHHAGRTEEERAATRQKQADAAVCHIWTRHKPGFAYPKGHIKLPTDQDLARREFTRVRAASVKRILRDIAEVQPDLIRDAIIAGLLAPPPRSFPYVALAAAYLDGKPIDADRLAESQQPGDLSDLTREQLLDRAVELARHLRDEAQDRAAIATQNIRGTLPVIDITPGGDK